MTPELHLHDTRSGRKRPFEPADPQRVTMYVCGPTVYARVHIGNGRPAVVFDVLYRLLQVLYPRVDYVRNITDIDDKINAAARANGEPIAALTARFIDAYREDIAALGVLDPDEEPLATGHIDEIIAMIQALIAGNHAYVGDGHVLFHVPSDPDYGSLSHRSLEDMIDGARVDVAPYKRDPKDFVLWKPSTPELPGWDSPWGRGRPGWHIECSAMIKKHLGETIDIHGGGSDLTFPHHENEAAQSRCANRVDDYVRYWLHNGMLTLGQEKMSKSLGNIVTIHELLERHDGEVLRYALLSGHYRQALVWSDDLLTQATASLDRLYEALRGQDDPERTSAI
ncbi:MAG: cysteine--tRNA ligase, partial [Pseudomonadales bacterium]